MNTDRITRSAKSFVSVTRARTHIASLIWYCESYDTEFYTLWSHSHSHLNYCHSALPPRNYLTFQCLHKSQFSTYYPGKSYHTDRRENNFIPRGYPIFYDTGEVRMSLMANITEKCNRRAKLRFQLRQFVAGKGTNPSFARLTYG